MKYIIKRVIIGVGIGICMLFARHAFAATFSLDAGLGSNSTVCFPGEAGAVLCGQVITMSDVPGTVNSVDFWVSDKDSTGPTGDMTAYIYNTTTGVPSGAALATSNTVSETGLPTTCTQKTFTFSTPYDVSGGTYAFVLGDSQHSNVHYIALCQHTGSSYAQLSYSYSGSWSAYASGRTMPLVIDYTASGGGGTTPVGGATSTTDQAEQNLYSSFIIYFLSFFGMIYILKPK